MPTILIIDDDESIRTGLRLLLVDLGYAVECASDGARGVALLHHIHPDIVITDVFMPDQDGLETIARLRREFPSLPIIAMSGGASAPTHVDYLDVARRVGADAIVHKPFGIHALLHAIHVARERRAHRVLPVP